MNYKKIRSFAAALTFAVLLTGCNRYGTDIPEKYKDYFDYTFNGSYSVELTEEGVINEDTDHEQGYRYWNVTYTDKFGKQHSEQMAGAQLSKAEKKYYKTQEWYDVFNTHAFVTSQMRTIGEQELWDEILTKYLDVDFVQGEVTHKGEECSLTMMIMNVIYDFDETGFRYAKQMLSPETGHNISECDLTRLMQDEDFMLTLSVRLKPGVDAAPYQEKIVQIEKELLAYTGGVRNYMIILKQDGDEESTSATTFYDHKVFLDEDFTPDPSIEYDSLAKAVIRNWKKKYE